MKKVFISYNTADLVLAKSIYKALNKSGISAWFAPKDIPVTDYYPINIVKAIKNCTLFLLIASENSLGNSDKEMLGSLDVIKELHIAVENRIDIVPVNLDKAIDNNYDYALQYHLGIPQSCDISNIDDLDQQVNKIVAAVKDKLDNPNSNTFLAEASNNAQTKILNNVEILLTEGHWKLAGNILTNNAFSSQYNYLVLLNRIFIKLQKTQYLKNLTTDSANDLHCSIKELQKYDSPKYNALTWYLIANLSKKYYEYNAVFDPTEGFYYSKKMFKAFSLPRLSARTSLILSHLKDIERL